MCRAGYPDSRFFNPLIHRHARGLTIPADSPPPAPCAQDPSPTIASAARAYVEGEGKGGRGEGDGEGEGESEGEGEKAGRWVKAKVRIHVTVRPLYGVRVDCLFGLLERNIGLVDSKGGMLGKSEGERTVKGRAECF